MKKILYPIVALMFLIAACSQNTGGQQSTQSSPQKIASMGEREKYATFEAEFTCKLVSSENPEDIAAALKEFVPLAQKYGYTEETANYLKEKYEKDESFRDLVLEKVRKMCPETASKFEQTP